MHRGWTAIGVNSSWNPRGFAPLFAHTRPTLRPSVARRLVLPGPRLRRNGSATTCSGALRSTGGFWGTRTPRKSVRPNVAPEPHDPYAVAAPYAFDERVQQEVGEPLGCVLLALRVLLLLPDSPDVTGHACGGKGKSPSTFGNWPNCREQLCLNWQSAENRYRL